MPLHDLVTDGQAEPRPLPTSFVVKNGSNSRGRDAGSTPGPVSVTSTTMFSPDVRASIAISPRSRTASLAFSSRFRKTWFSCPGWQLVLGSGAYCSRTTMLGGSERLNMATVERSPSSTLAASAWDLRRA